MWVFCDFVLLHGFVADERLLASSLASLDGPVDGVESLISRIRFNFFAVWIAFESWLSWNVPVFSELSELCDWGDVVFLLFGDFEPAADNFFEFGEFNLRHCDTFACVFEAHLAADCFFGDSLNSRAVSDACLKCKNWTLAHSLMATWIAL